MSSFRSSYPRLYAPKVGHQLGKQCAYLQPPAYLDVDQLSTRRWGETWSFIARMNHLAGYLLDLYAKCN